MKRWAIARMVDDGSGGLESALNRYRCNTRLWTKPGFGWCFAQIASAQIAAMSDDADIYVLPDGVMDMSVGSIPVAVRNTMRTRLEAGGFVFTAVKTSWTVRQLLQYLKGQVDALGDIEAGDVIDIEQ